MRKILVLAAAIVMSALLPVVAQEKPQPAAAAPSTTSGSRQVPLQVRLTLSKTMGEKKISSVPYMLGVLSNSQKTSLRMGVQVPVMTTVSVGNTPQGGYTYRDVGTNIDCSAQDAGNGVYNLNFTIEDSSIQMDSIDQGEQKKIARDVPAFRSFRVSFAMLLREGQSMQYASATDPISGEVMKVDVTLALAK
jgi:hypothetical protein